MYQNMQRDKTSRAGGGVIGHDRFSQINAGSKRRKKFLNRKTKSTPAIDPDILTNLYSPPGNSLNKIKLVTTKLRSCSLDDVPKVGILSSDWLPLRKKESDQQNLVTTSIDSMSRLFNCMTVPSENNSTSDESIQLGVFR